jgi:hypothetical protein
MPLFKELPSWEICTQLIGRHTLKPKGSFGGLHEGEIHISFSGYLALGDFSR